MEPTTSTTSKNPKALPVAKKVSKISLAQAANKNGTGVPAKSQPQNKANASNEPKSAKIGADDENGEIDHGGEDNEDEAAKEEQAESDKDDNEEETINVEVSLSICLRIR